MKNTNEGIHPDTEKPKAVKVTVTVPQETPENPVWADYNVDIYFKDSVSSAQLSNVALGVNGIQLPISLSQLLDPGPTTGTYSVFLIDQNVIPANFQFPPSSPSSTIKVFFDGSDLGNEAVPYHFP